MRRSRSDASAPGSGRRPQCSTGRRDVASRPPHKSLLAPPDQALRPGSRILNSRRATRRWTCAGCADAGWTTRAGLDAAKVRLDVGVVPLFARPSRPTRHSRRRSRAPTSSLFIDEEPPSTFLGGNRSRARRVPLRCGQMVPVHCACGRTWRSPRWMWINCPYLSAPPRAPRPERSYRS